MNFIFKLLALLAIPAVALANPSLGVDSGSKTDNSESSSVKRDKSISNELGRGNRDSRSRSHDNSTEASVSASRSARRGTSQDEQRSNSVDININSLLLSEFTARYERGDVGLGAAWDYFNTCKPIMRAEMDYPVWNLVTGGVSGRIAASRTAAGPNGGYVVSAGPGTQHPMVDPSNRYVARYSQCRMVASYWLAAAAERASSQSVRGEDEIREHIQDAFDAMDSDPTIFADLRQRARDVWSNAICGNMLDDWDSYKSPNFDCGVFRFVGSTFTVENRETLSEKAIAGRSYKVAMSASNSNSVAQESSISSDRRDSESYRRSTSHDNFNEGKVSVSSSRGKSTETRETNSKSNGTSASIGVSPRE